MKTIEKNNSIIEQVTNGDFKQKCLLLFYMKYLADTKNYECWDSMGRVREDFSDYNEIPAEEIEGMLWDDLQEYNQYNSLFPFECMNDHFDTVGEPERYKKLVEFLGNYKIGYDKMDGYKYFEGHDMELSAVSHFVAKIYAYIWQGDEELDPEERKLITAYNIFIKTL